MAYSTMNGLMNASVSEGSSHFAASVTWSPQVIVPSGAAATGPPRVGSSSKAASVTIPTRAKSDLMTPPGAIVVDACRAPQGRRHWGKLRARRGASGPAARDVRGCTLRACRPARNEVWRSKLAQCPCRARRPGRVSSPHLFPQPAVLGGSAMQTNGHSEARKLRSRLSHPIIDADGHWIEYAPVMREEFRRIGGEAAAEAYDIASQRVPNSLKMTLAERRRRRVGQEAFWGSPCENVLDRATAMLPRLMYERLDDLGIDFCVVYPTAGLGYHRMPDTRQRRAICRAYNVFAADQFRGLEDRVIPAAIIPMYTPEEAIEEIEFASKQLGYKVIMVGGLMRRPIPALLEEKPDAAKLAEWYDVIGIDSDHDYDPVWAKCRELKIAPSFHNGARSILLRNSPSNFCNNHIGHFASAGHAVCKALFFGGVTRRFPDLNFAFLEGGVGWACMLYADLIGHWEK